MATKKKTATPMNSDVMSDGRLSYHKQADGRYLQVGSDSKRTLNMWFAAGVILTPVAVPEVPVEVEAE